MQSEVARLRAQIEDECRALKHLESFSAVARHEAIQRQYERVGSALGQLAEFVGQVEATSIAFALYDLYVMGGNLDAHIEDSIRSGDFDGEV